MAPLFVFQGNIMDYTAEMQANLDVERAIAASQGADCIIFGLVVLQPAGCIEWFNRFHRDFSVAEQGFSKTIGVIGITADGRGYTSVQPGCERYHDTLSAFFRELSKDVPDKNTLRVRLPLSKLIYANSNNQ